MNDQLQQSIQQLRAQKQRMQHEQIELESALEELDGSSDSYKVIGNLMVKKDPQEIKEDLDTELKTLKNRIKGLEQQEQRLKQKVQEAAQASESARDD